MFFTISKIMFQNGKSYLLFVFIATFLSLFSYILSSNIILSVDEYLKSQVKPLLWGDVVLSSREANFVTEDFLANYSEDFEIARTIETSTTLFDTNKNPELIELIYHDDNYPIYDTFSYDTIDQSGSLIVAPEVFEKFGPEIELFETSYSVGGVITSEPLEGVSLFSSFSEMYLPLSEYRSDINEDNSRLSYTAYLKFKNEYSSDIVEVIKSDPSLSWVRIRSLEDRNETIGWVTDRLYLFIHFFNLIVFILTFFIIILSLETYYKKLKNTIWLLSILGLKKSRIFFYSLSLLSVIFFVSLILSLVVNTFAIQILSGYYDFFTSHNISLIKGIAISCVLLIVGIYSPFFKIYSSDIRGLLSDSSDFSYLWLRQYGVYLFLIFLGFFAVWYISSLGIIESLLYSLGFILLIIFLYFVVRSVLRLCFRLLHKRFSPKKNFYIFDALRSTLKPGNVSFLIIFSSFVSFASIFLFYVFSTSFLGYMQALTQNSNDTFVINVGKDDITLADDFFSQDEIFEIISLRISEINGKTLAEHLWVERVSRQFSREFSSTTKNFDHEIEKGALIDSGGVSVDEAFAESLGVTIGDRILFTVAWLKKELRVTSLRLTEQVGANPFFYFTLHPGDFEQFPRNYFISYKSLEKPDDIQFQFSEVTTGNISFIDTKEIIAIVIDVVEKIVVIVYFCLIYISIFSFLTFIVSVTFLRTFKTQKLRLMYILWWARKKLLFWVFFEYSYLIVVGLALSLVVATPILLALQYFIDFFELHLFSYISWLGILVVLYIIMTLYLRFSKTHL